MINLPITVQDTYGESANPGEGLMFQTEANYTSLGDFEVQIARRTDNGLEHFFPIVEDGVKWETHRQGSPGKLTFRVYKDASGKLAFHEGDLVALYYFPNGKPQGYISKPAPRPARLVFAGYVFTKKRNKDGWIEVVAYDLLRYLKNKYTLVYTNWTATELIKHICKLFALETIIISETDYKIGKAVEDDQTLFDIIQNALDKTYIQTGNQFVLLVYQGKVCLLRPQDMRTNFIIREDTIGDYDYSSSIDEDTYNEIELYYDDDETNQRTIFHEEDTSKWGKWGRLRYTENVKSTENQQYKAKQLLKLHNRVHRTLKVKGAWGNHLCMAGTMVYVDLNVGDIKIDGYMQVEQATHTFKKNEYRMDLTLRSEAIDA